ncbi:hypothetical protein ONS95_014666 [Cadophora gregata]|uniref:uncharacterized protein n=1 Tax=Cadophora gregata TaxID=51156 RepID=UPI0026DCFA90|nr:uncharacterized protein ONS95_014666 [Cadophora gregata]KAK0112949.1 hypothetical protein ONS95_014666 [Cadophora gregata]
MENVSLLGTRGLSFCSSGAPIYPGKLVASTYFLGIRVSGWRVIEIVVGRGVSANVCSDIHSGHTSQNTPTIGHVGICQHNVITSSTQQRARPSLLSSSYQYNTTRISVRNRRVRIM